MTIVACIRQEKWRHASRSEDGSGTLYPGVKVTSIVACIMHEKRHHGSGSEVVQITALGM